MNITRFLFLFLLGMVPTIIWGLELPSEFHLEPTADNGLIDLVWSSDTVQIPTGASRPEFRLADGTVLGYPREVQGGLRLSLTTSLEATLESIATLQTWWGSRRIDANAPPNVAVSYDAPTTMMAAAPTVDTNPAAPGNFTIRRALYTLADGLSIEAYPFPIEVLAEVTDPPQATLCPLVLFLHGRHATCYQTVGPNATDSGDWPCLPGWRPIPSHEGYRYVADVLASQGYIVVSISANGISGQDYISRDGGAATRSTLLRHHLSLWVQWNTNGGSPWGDRFQGRVDMNRVVLVGHSRGGEGVHKAAIDASPSDPYKIVGLVTYGPTAFGRLVTPDVHSANILPTCDGDVFDLQGQLYVDISRDVAYSEALRSAVIAVGANHNYFNTEWTPGLAVAPAQDDWEYFFDPDDPVCSLRNGTVRLTPEEQRSVGAAYTIALIRLAVAQDATMLPLLDGSNVRPAVLGRANVATSAVGGAQHRILYRVQDFGRPKLQNGMQGGECLGNPYSRIIFPFAACGNFQYFSSPHWLPLDNICRFQFAMELRWANRVGAAVQFSVPASRRNFTILDSLDVRIANDPANSGVALDMIIADENGRNATLSTNLATIEGWPGVSYQDRLHARTFRGSLASASSNDVDLGNIVAIFLVAQSATGRVWVLDIAASQARIAVPAVLNLSNRAVGRCPSNGWVWRLIGF